MCVFFVCRQRITFEPKWHISLTDLTLDDKVDLDGIITLILCSDRFLSKMMIAKF